MGSENDLKYCKDRLYLGHLTPIAADLATPRLLTARFAKFGFGNSNLWS